LNPKQADGWACIGDIYERSGRYSQAEEALKKALDLDPSEKGQLVNTFALGKVLAEEGKRMGVMHIYERLKTLDRNYADRYYQLFVQPMLDPRGK
jgi:tetratricopeptide (TPR) repeat protein